MNDTAYLIVNNHNIGKLVSSDNSYYTFITPDKSTYKLTYNNMYIKIKKTYLNFINKYYDESFDVSNYKMNFFFSLNEIFVTIKSYANIYNYRLDLNTLKEINNDTKFYTFLAGFIHELNNLDKYYYKDYPNLSLYLNSIINLNNNYLNLDTLNNTINLFKEINDLTLIYNIYRNFINHTNKDLLYLYTTLILNIKETNNLAEIILKDLPFNLTINKQIKIFLNNLENKIPSSNYIIKCFIVKYLIYNDYLSAFILIYSYKKDIMISYDLVYQIFKNINDLKLILDIIKKNYNYTKLDLTVLNKALIELFPYHHNKGIYNKYLNYLQLFKYLDLNEQIKFLDYSDLTNINYFMSKSKQFIDINLKDSFKFIYLVIKEYNNKYKKDFLNLFNDYPLLKYIINNIDYTNKEDLNIDLNDINNYLILTNLFNINYEFKGYNDILYLYFYFNLDNINIFNLIIDLMNNEIKLDSNLNIDFNLNILAKHLINHFNLNKVIKTKVDEYISLLEKNKETTLLNNLKLYKDELTNNLISINNTSFKISLKFPCDFSSVQTKLYYNVPATFNLAISHNKSKYYDILDLNKLVNDFKNKKIAKYGRKLEFIHDVLELSKNDYNLLIYLANNYELLNDKLNKDLIYFILTNFISDNILILDQFNSGNSYIFNYNKIDFKIIIDKDYTIKIATLNDFILSDSKFVIYDYFIFIKIGCYIYIIDKNLANYEFYRFCIMNQNISYFNIKDEFINDFYYPNQKLITLDDELLLNIKVKDDIKINAYFDFINNKIILNTIYKLNDLEINLNDVLKYNNNSNVYVYLKYIKELNFKDNILNKEKDILNFLNLDFSYLRTLANIYLGENLQNKKIINFNVPNIIIKNHNNLIISTISKTNYSENELKDIIKAINNKKEYLLLNNNIITFNTEALDFVNNIKELGYNNNDLLFEDKNICLYNLFKINNKEKIISDNYINELFKDFKNYASLDYKLPNIMASLRDYQVVGFKWLKLLNKYHLGGILADEMGLGKTLEVITLLSSLDSNLPVLIISPKSLIFNWYNEINRFNSNLKVISIYGDGKERIKIINNIKEEFIIYLTSYESILRDIELYQDINFNYVILDEAQAIKNVLALKSKAVKTLKCENKLCLTGTPIENNIIDLWSIFDFLMPNFLPKLKEYKELYDNNYNLDKLALKITPFILRRTKKDVLKDLPEKFETLITVELNETERKIYDAEIMLARKALKENNKIFSILPYLIKLREICLSSSLVTNYNKISSKLNMLIEIVQTYLKNNHKILIFSSFVEGLNLVANIFKTLNINYYMLSGATKAIERLELVNDFNANKDVNCFLISLKAGGVGLNLYGADTVIHLDPWWNVAAENQASDRAHRIGQVRNVEVIKLISLDTIEQRIIELQNHKLDLFNKLIDNDFKIENLSIEDLNFILN